MLLNKIMAVVTLLVVLSVNANAAPFCDPDIVFTPGIDFGSVSFGESKDGYIRVCNTDQNTQSLIVDWVDTDNGPFKLYTRIFSLKGKCRDPLDYLFGCHNIGECQDVYVNFSPTAEQPSGSEFLNFTLGSLCQSSSVVIGKGFNSNIVPTIIVPLLLSD